VGRITARPGPCRRATTGRSPTAAVWRLKTPHANAICDSLPCWL